ncbi:hypothetical protein ACHQM5_012284 [Ranunculus cassubicifolius]
MVKVKVDSSVQQTAQQAHHTESDDRISELSEDILSFILSLLNIRDAVRSRVLSSRWRYLSASITDLCFDEPTLFGIRKVVGKSPNGKKGESKFVGAVDQFLELYNISKISSFKICYCFGSKLPSYINKWINFAIEKQTEKLELDFTYRYFTRQNGGVSRMTKLYDFPSCLIFRAKPCVLKHLSLTYCSMSQNAFECVFLECVNLESLVLKNCDLPDSVFIYKPFFYLRSLIFYNCEGGRNIELSINISTFDFYGKMTYLKFVGSPCVERASICLWSGYVNEMAYIFDVLPNEASQLQYLSLSFSTSKLMQIPETMPKFRHLKDLELAITLYPKFDLMSIVTLLNASPRLQKLRLVLKHCASNQQLVKKDISMESYFYELRQVEINAFRASSNALELIRCLLTRSLRLERMILGINQEVNWGNNEWRYAPSYDALNETECINKMLLENLNPNAEIIVI